MKKIVLSVLILGILLMIAGSVSAITPTADDLCVTDQSCDTVCRVVIDEPVAGNFYDPVTIRWHYTGNCNPLEAYLAYQKGSCGSPFNWVKIAENLNPSNKIYEWDVSGFNSGQYCIAVNIDQLSGPDAGSTSGLFYLDLDAPTVSIIVGTPKEIVGEDTYVSTQTPITLECTDDGEFNSGVDYIEYKINDGSWTTYEDPFTFSESSYHTLEARCFDNVGKSDTKTQDFIVDATAPVITRTVGEPSIPTEGGYFVTENTEICVSAMNGESELHPVPGKITITCEGVQLGENNCFHYTEDSNHVLNCEAKDALGNTGIKTWNDVVESVAPTTSISYEGPQYTDGKSLWIDGVSKVVLSAQDSEPHPSGVDTTYYRYYIVNDKYCVGTQDEFVTPESVPSFSVYESPFSMDQSCHAIEFYSIDKLGNEETVKRSFVFVDKTAPLTSKVVGKPNHKCTVGDNQCESDWDYTVTVNTPITLSCTDQLPHPSGVAKLCYRVTLDGNAQEWVCENTNQVIVQFPEESEHLLEFYCVDHVNKTSAVDSEMFKVAGEEFTIPLYQKWNLISIPFNLLSDNVEEVFSQIANDTEIVWSYDETGWHVYSPTGPSDLSTIKPGYGYWVKAKKDTQLVVGGSLLSPAPGVPPSRQLQKGWNLIGRYGLTEDQTAQCALFSLVDTTIGHPRWSALYSYNAVSDQFMPLSQTSLTNPGEGYWVEMDVEDNYSPATACWKFTI
jgi:hypothetical protein